MIVTGTKISITRGDYGCVLVSVKDGALEDGDKIELTVRKYPTHKSKLIHKTVTEFSDGKAIIGLFPEDTASLPFGEYVYDVQLTPVDGKVATIIKPSVFEVLPEVSYD